MLLLRALSSHRCTHPLEAHLSATIAEHHVKADLRLFCNLEIASRCIMTPLAVACAKRGSICVMVPKKTENWMRFSAQLGDGTHSVRFERIAMN